MAQKAIREFDGKRILANWLGKAWEEEAGADQAPIAFIRKAQIAQIKPTPGTPVTAESLVAEHPWVTSCPLVAKPDQLIKRRGKAGLLKLNADPAAVAEWINDRAHKPVSVEAVTGNLDTFLVEPFLPHAASDEYYICIQSHRTGEEVLFHHEGGVDVGDVDAKAFRLEMPTGTALPSAAAVRDALLSGVPEARKDMVASFVRALLKVYIDLHFVYLEINPLVVTDTEILPLDMAAKLDEAAAFAVGKKWGADMDFPAPFGRAPEPEEAYIRDLDSKTGASLKLIILNRAGRVWTMVAGGGASVVYADTVADLGFGRELANYGEYSGAPSKDATYEYAKTILSLMGKDKIAEPKVLIIGGGIANFTDVASTFTGIIAALRDYRDVLLEHRVSIWVRRGGPNCQEGLRAMRHLGPELGIPMNVFGPETHITAIVPMALGCDVPASLDMGPSATESAEPLSVMSAVPKPPPKSAPPSPAVSDDEADTTVRPPRPPKVPAAGAAAGEGAAPSGPWQLFTPDTRCIVFGMQQRAVQGMLDFDYLCKRAKPSVAAMVFPFSGNHFQKFYWGDVEVMIPVYTATATAMEKHPDISVFVNFASFRSVYDSTMEALSHKGIRTIAIIAEGVPEQHTRILLKAAVDHGVTMIGPATVGGVKPGSFRIGNTGGMLDNIIASKLYRPGSVAYVSKSGGMSNELNNIVSRVTDGVCEGVAIGGDRYPGTRFLDHMLRYEANPAVKMMVLLGEVGGVDEYDICEAMKDGRITKPVVAWCIGTCAKIFPFEVQFGHAGALANTQAGTAAAKNAALAAAGAVVPGNFNELVSEVRRTYRGLVASGAVVEREEPEPPRVPMDYSWAKKLGLVRKPAAFVSSISDERGEELMYAGMPISQAFEEKVGVGGVVSLLWFKRRLPDYATQFIEMVLMVTADHGPAVSGAHNTIVTARAGKDLISSLTSGLLTIGPRFGGALDEAAAMFSKAYDGNLSPVEFVADMRRQNKLIMGIGHRIKTVTNPDKRVSIIKDYAMANFESTEVLRYALEVEKVTTQKKANLILNVDGCIAVCFVDLLRSCGAFTKEEADENIANGVLNGLFVLGRSIGFIGHFLDQKRLKQGLYRHPWDDISYQV